MWTWDCDQRPGPSPGMFDLPSRELLPRRIERGAAFGDFDGDGYDDLAVGIRRRNVRDLTDAVDDGREVLPLRAVREHRKADATWWPSIRPRP